MNGSSFRVQRCYYYVKKVEIHHRFSVIRGENIAGYKQPLVCVVPIWEICMSGYKRS